MFSLRFMTFGNFLEKSKILTSGTSGTRVGSLKIHFGHVFYAFHDIWQLFEKIEMLDQPTTFGPSDGHDVHGSEIF
jgi:hypothetical protein